jgi:hypothetical protein
MVQGIIKNDYKNGTFSSSRSNSTSAMRRFSVTNIQKKNANNVSIVREGIKAPVDYCI